MGGLLGSWLCFTVRSLFCSQWGAHLLTAPTSLRCWHAGSCEEGPRPRWHRWQLGLHRPREAPQAVSLGAVCVGATGAPRAQASGSWCPQHQGPGPAQEPVPVLCPGSAPCPHCHTPPSSPSYLLCSATGQPQALLLSEGEAGCCGQLEVPVLSPWAGLGRGSSLSKRRSKEEGQAWGWGRRPVSSGRLEGGRGFLLREDRGRLQVRQVWVRIPGGSVLPAAPAPHIQ